MRARLSGIVGITTVLLTLPAFGTTGAERCETGKLTAAGKYDLCRLKATAKAARIGGVPDYAKCDSKFASKWDSAESAGGGMCPSSGDKAAVQAFISDHTEDLAVALAGGSLPDCPGDLARCESGAAACAADLATCNSERQDLNGDLNTCINWYLATSNELSSCTNTLSAAQADLSACSANLATCTATSNNLSANLGLCQSALAGTQQLLSTCTSNLFVAENCGDGLIDDGEECDQGNLNGATCVTQGFLGGEVKCASGCTLDTSGCWNARFIDNADGTITDSATGLQWEKLGDDGGLHDQDTRFTWFGASTKLSTLNAITFGGHADWRLPTMQEAQSLVDFTQVSPAIDPAFDSGCQPGCDVTACSCTAATWHWTSTEYAPDASEAWYLDYNFGGAGAFSKTAGEGNKVRAVRGGS